MRAGRSPRGPTPTSVAGVEDSARLYGFGAVKTKVDIVHADRNTPGFMRSPPVVPYIYALESAMDELAVKLDMDPIELRRINDSMTDADRGKPWSSRSLMKCYDEAAERFGWTKRDAEPGSMRDGDWLIGWGCATRGLSDACRRRHRARAAAAERPGAGADRRARYRHRRLHRAWRRWRPSGSAFRSTTVTSRSATAICRRRRSPAARTTTASACSAVMKACDAIRAKLSAAQRGARKPSAAADGRRSAERLEREFKRLGVGAIEEYAEFLPPACSRTRSRSSTRASHRSAAARRAKKLMYALGAEFVEVRIHARTREIRVPRMVGAFAAGRIMNPRTARSQYLGGDDLGHLVRAA